MSNPFGEPDEGDADGKILEGFICPICREDLKSLEFLTDHFDKSHAEDDDIKTLFKEIFSKAKKRINFDLSRSLEKNASISTARGGLEQTARETSNERSRMNVFNFMDHQEIGLERSQSDYFQAIRNPRLERYASETNKLIIRLHKLLKDMPSDAVLRKQHEQNIVPWLDGSSVKLCPNCAKSFHIAKRQHHCRLCGSIMCHDCSKFLPLDTAFKTTADPQEPENMTEETFVLVMLVIVMLVGSYMAGSIPLVMKLSEKKLKLVTVLGAGLLVGTALTVIIPEGIRSLYTELKTPVLTKATLDSPTPNTHEDEKDHSRTIGLSLVLGFVFMMLVDQISQKRQQELSPKDKNITATLGLVVHAAADGVALGAAATTSHKDVEMIVFLAIMLHKAPAAFGLVSFLLHEKIERQQIRKHLAIFSLSAPLLTLLTYFGIGQEQKETLNSVNATGIAMLFSAGTFLYVATVHVLPELTQGTHASSHSSQYRLVEEDPDLQAQITSSGLSFSELIIMIFGALLPLVITFGHHH